MVAIVLGVAAGLAADGTTVVSTGLILRDAELRTAVLCSCACWVGVADGRLPAGLAVVVALAGV